MIVVIHSTDLSSDGNIKNINTYKDLELAQEISDKFPDAGINLHIGSNIKSLKSIGQ